MSSTAQVIAVTLALGAIATVVLVPQADPAPRTMGPSFKVATWNIRSGMGIHRSEAAWDSNTLNCTDLSKPVNAWGVGLPQRALSALRDDPLVIAVAVQEAWNCGRPAHINEALGFRTITRERGGIALAARYGFSGEPVYQAIDTAHDRWLVGGTICLSPTCERTVGLFSTHWGGKTNNDFPEQAQAALAFLAAQPLPHAFMGDLNVFQIDRWNPRVPCTAPDDVSRSRTLSLIARAGYVDAWGATQSGEGFTGMASRAGCGRPDGSYYKRIDYVFLRGLHALATDRFARSAPGGDAASDHAGLIAELAFPAPATE